MTDMIDSPPPMSAEAALPDCLRVIGFPGAFLDWGVAMLRAQIEARGRAAETVWLPLAEGVEIGPDAPVRLLVSCGPDYAVPDAALPTLVLLDDVAACITRQLADTADVVAVARAMTATLATLGPVLRLPGTVLVRPDRLSAAAPQIAAALRQDGLVEPAIPAPPAMPEGALSGLAGDVCTQLLAPMLESVLSGVPQSYELPWRCLSWRAQEPAVPVMDLAGPARPLYFGPYFHFLPGAWTLELELFFSDDVGDASFAAELFTGSIVSRGRMRPGRGGLFRAQIPVRVDTPEVTTEVRIWVERGVIEGRMGLRRVVFRPR